MRAWVSEAVGGRLVLREVCTLTIAAYAVLVHVRDIRIPSDMSLPSLVLCGLSNTRSRTTRRSSCRLPWFCERRFTASAAGP
jgi:hypothetical protein